MTWVALGLLLAGVLCLGVVLGVWIVLRAIRDALVGWEY